MRDLTIHSQNLIKQSFKEKMILTYLMVAVFLLVIADISMDFVHGMSLKELAMNLILEGCILLVVFYITSFIWSKFTLESEGRVSAENDLELVKLRAIAWEEKSNQFVKEFQSYILLKFNEWNLSKSEREIALLILRGKSSKEISAHRFTSERTIRNQSRSIYEKSNLAGKNELGAFFLDELLEDFVI